MALAVVERRPSQGDPLVEGDVVADFGGLANDHARTMVDEQPGANLGSGMDLDACEQQPDIRRQARQEQKTVAPQKVSDPICNHRMQAGVCQQYLNSGARCGIALHNRPNIVPKALENHRPHRVILASSRPLA